MMNPAGTKHKLVGWSQQKLSSCYQGETEQDIIGMINKAEPEIVFFPEIRGLAIQGHPEWVRDTHPFAELCVDLVKDYLLEEVASPV
jgi:hypothetical protein